MSTSPRPTRVLFSVEGAKRGRGRVRSAKGNQSINTPSLSSQSPTPGLLGRVQECWYQVPHWSAIDQFARSKVWLNLLSMFAPILFVIAVSVVSSALSLLYACICMNYYNYLFFSGPRFVACFVSYPGFLTKFVNIYKKNKLILILKITILQLN